MDSVHKGDELRQILRSLGDHQAELGQMTTQGVQRLSALTNKQITRPEYDRSRLRHFAFDRYEPHGRPLRRFADRLGVGRIVFLPLNEWFYIGRGDQLDGVSELGEFAPQGRLVL